MNTSRTALVKFMGASRAASFKYILLAGLYDPEGGLTRRVLTILLEGVALGTLRYQPLAPATGYVAFCTGLLYLAGLAMLPTSAAPRALVRGAGDGVLDPRPTGRRRSS